MDPASIVLLLFSILMFMILMAIPVAGIILVTKLFLRMILGKPSKRKKIKFK